MTVSSENRIQPRISIVTPVYRCAECLQTLYERVVDAVSPLTEEFQLIMVNDGSPDDAWATIQRLSQQDCRVVGIDLSRNFGQHHAITAGLDHARGDWVVVMDCDLQDQPEDIPKLYAKAQEGYEVVFGRRTVRKDTLRKKLGSIVFYKVLEYFTDQKFDASIGNFSIVARKVVDAMSLFREKNRNYVLTVKWLGFRSTGIEVSHASRFQGESSYTLRKLIYFAYDIIITHSNKPLRLSIMFGFLMSLVAFAYGIYLAANYFWVGVPVAGWTSTMVSIFLVGGILLANMGVIGLYLGKVFNEGKDRPIYVVRQTTNLD